MFKPSSAKGVVCEPGGGAPPPLRTMNAFGSFVHAARPLAMFDAAFGTLESVPLTKNVTVAPDSPPCQRAPRVYADAGGDVRGLG